MNVTIRKVGDRYQVDERDRMNFVPYFGREYCDQRDLRWTVERLKNLGFTVLVIEKEED
jgi:hypothetical protein